MRNVKKHVLFSKIYIQIQTKLYIILDHRETRIS